MPKNGYDCPMCRDGMCIIPGKDSDGICLSFGPYEEKRPNDCPLVEVPEPHGRLIDADKLMKRMWNETDCMISVPATFVRDAPTVIPASEAE